MASPVYEPPAPMTAAQKALIDRENHFRQLFAENPSSSELSDPYVTLMDVFAHENEFGFADEDEEEQKVPKVLTQYRKLGLTGKAIVSENEFTVRFSEFTRGILNGLDWNNVFCAGGAILGNIIKDNAGFTSSDIDLFLYGLDSDEKANQKLREIHKLIVANTGSRGDVIRTARAITILNTHPYRHVQVVLRVYKSPSEVLLGFDIDSCTVGYDGKKVYCMERFKRAITKRYNLVNTSRRSLTYEQRLAKYARRGFGVAVPNLDKSKVNPEIFKLRIPNVFGLTKLLLYDHIAQNSIHRIRNNTDPARDPIAGILRNNENSDYNGDLNIPWGPHLSVDAIMKTLKFKDRMQFFGQLRAMKQASKSGVSAPFGTQQKKPEHLFESIFLDSADESGQKQPKIEWIRNNPAYQDIDGDFVRPLMTGSFQLPPPVQAVWDSGTYGTTTENSQGMSNDPGYNPSTYVPTQFDFGPSKPSMLPKAAPSSGPAFAHAVPKIIGTKKAPSKAPLLEPKKFAIPKKSAVPKSKPQLVQKDSSESEDEVLPRAPKSVRKTTGGKSPRKSSGGFGSSATTSTTSSNATRPGGIFGGAPFFGSVQQVSSAPWPAIPAGTPSSNIISSIEDLLRQQFNQLKELITLQQQVSSSKGHSSSLQHPTGQDEAPPTTKLLLLVALCTKQGSITSEERGTLKDLIIARNQEVFAALDVFELDQDLEELVDTLKRVVKHSTSQKSGN